MRCRACDGILTDFESTRRYSSGGSFIDMCSQCLAWSTLDIETSENLLLIDEQVDDVTSAPAGFLEGERPGGNAGSRGTVADSDEYDPTDDRGT